MFLNAKIETDRLIIRPFCLEDLDELYSVVSEENFHEYIPEETPTRENLEKNIIWSMQQNKKNTQDKIYKFNLSIIHKKDQKLIGFCGLGPDDLNMGETEIYYGISSLYRKQGLAFEAAKATLQYGFEVIGLSKIIAFVDYRNEPSIGIVNNLGMKYHFRIGNLTEQYKDFEGQCYYTMLAEEYFHKVN
ncbi:RimJ/RimL family protein N-acetyltransferase [Ureibacillus xyleni]|uniref:RimJ/RimL family protein N-acetyltransferase n=1 Tax=Ureibacillus xyleni TaxID=614648 RepID=A0A285TNY0_9BACL|nr:GNAT family N-acetyltransferase [Ureibacillus xyleni]SOC24348.1 RimJ/RimL family protein N-acetyltransferase [Ureibacillus xyleni]